MSGNIPLAQALRPENLDGFAGQEKALSKVLPLAGEGRLPNFLFAGPTGCGKSTLALLLARKSKLPFEHFSAPQAGIPRIRGVKAPVLILDEIHRFTKAQQDYFLPLMEEGKLILLATTTENPEVALTPQLLSRLHTVRLSPLSKDALAKIAEKGLAEMGISADSGLVDFLCRFSGGDARSLLSAIELLPSLETADPAALAELLPERLNRHGDESHHTKISALIKSIRKSAPQAAIYWLAALLKSCEDPLYICRRLVISAAEDIGLADPQALAVAESCMSAVERIGVPEGGIVMSECVLYLAMAPKSRSACKALAAAFRHIDGNGIAPVPGFLRKPHSPGHMGYPERDYLPLPESESWLYRPVRSGKEEKIFETWKNTEEDFG